MQPGEMTEAAPPLVTFKLQAVEVASETEKAGRRVTRDAEFITITPPGGNLVVVKEIKDSNRQDIMRRFGPQYEAWKQGLEPPVDGTSLREWPVISPAECENLLACSIQTVEQLADVSENVINDIGMGARKLKQKAEAWLKTAQDVGQISLRLEAMEKEMKFMKTDISEKSQYIRQLEAELETKKRKRRKKVDDFAPNSAASS